MSDFTIIPSRLQFKSAPSIDQQVNLELSQTQEELTQFVRNTSLNLSQLYDDERQTCEVFRPTFKLQYLYDNTLTGTTCLLYTSPSPRDRQKSRMPSSA